MVILLHFPKHLSVGNLCLLRNIESRRELLELFLVINFITNLNKSSIYQKKTALPIALKQEIKKGKAYILCQLDKVTDKYEVEVCSVYQNSKENKDMVIKVTDERLLNKTGGIVQGMSGSPIIQNGKIIGAVTHVFVNDPVKGYGIFIERMLS